MSSLIETVPRDVLRYIAFLCSSSSTLEPPVAIYHLLQTSSAIYRSLNVPATPDLYAYIFFTKFDMQATFRRYRRRMTDSALAVELLRRSQLLRRSHRLDFSPDYLLQDLWAGLWIFLENDGLNQQQLSAVNFPNFILNLARNTLAELHPDGRTSSPILRHLIVWLLCLSLPRHLILDMSKQDRNELYSLIFPYIFLSSNKMTESRVPTTPLCQTVPFLGQEIGGGGSSTRRLYGTNNPSHVCIYYLRQDPSVPDPSTAAINLAFVILESTPVKVPYHLPETRAIATANQLSGPTKEDYYSLASYKTPLPSDNDSCTRLDQAHSLVTEGSQKYDVEFGCILRSLDDRGISDTFDYIPGTMTGLWEGVFRTVDALSGGLSSSIPFTPLFSALIMKPMQCKLVEYVCSVGDSLSNPSKKGEDVWLDPIRLVAKSDCEIIAQGRTYRKYVQGPADANRRPAQVPKSPYDVILLGEV
ncbi:hypothetical protein CPB84DRAFT_1847228 [Gymnopilus junonius]|uniref:Uncharacterized protein n=1 Tax=Gymnopilus junonius TaxID=109634 RepID=A0A9P5NPK5_GYMJU|nr:hypothetical protein CPB84DRAFT_1847228 [Gymnopilus junonius]